MQQNILFEICIIIFFTVLINSSCRTGPDIFDIKNIKGYVITKESCNRDETNDYWLIDFSYGANNANVGDTLVLNGITYTNVLKTKGLDPQLKTVGLRISIDYSIISIDKISTTGCNVTASNTYKLKELTIINQGEIR